MKDCNNLIKQESYTNLFFDNQLSLSKTFYKLANTFLDKKDLVKGLECFCDTFLLRNMELESINDEFLEFFKIQFIIYLLGKKRIKIALSEGDMIFDLIEDTFKELKKDIEDSPFMIQKENMRSFYKNVEIDFPWMMFEESAFA